MIPFKTSIPGCICVVSAVQCSPFHMAGCPLDTIPCLLYVVHLVVFFMLSGRDIHRLWGRPSELWVRQNRTGPLLLQSPAGKGLVPLDGSTISFSRSAWRGQMDTLQKDYKPSK